MNRPSAAAIQPSPGRAQSRTTWRRVPGHPQDYAAPGVGQRILEAQQRRSKIRQIGFGWKGVGGGTWGKAGSWRWWVNPEDDDG